jgi:serpin B
MWREFITISLFPIMLGAAPLTPTTDPGDLKQLTQDHAEFAFSLYSGINSDPSTNLIFSPYSITSCLEMLFIGARNETADEIQQTLHLELDRTQLLPLSSQLIQKLKSTGPQLDIANGMWLGSQFFVLSDYSHAIESAFQGKITRVDFTRPEQAAQTINQWILDKTRGKISNLIQTSDLDEATRLVLTNAVSFQGNWRSSFDPMLTAEHPFSPTPETSTSISMMKQTGSFPYFENDLIQMVALPFEGSLACVLLLPKSQENLAIVEADLTNTFTEWLSTLKKDQVMVQIPKFTTTHRLDLNQILQTLGMNLSFTTQANFSGIDGKLDLYVSKVVHQAFFSLDENGVTAAAATAASIGVKSLAPASPPVSFVADHPFLFFIIDLATQEMLFMGKFQLPSEAHGV